LSGRGLCDELITRPEESYRLCCVVVCDLETSRIGAPYIYIYTHIYIYIYIYDISSVRVKAVFASYVYVYISCTIWLFRLECNSLFVGLGVGVRGAMSEKNFSKSADDKADRLSV